MHECPVCNCSNTEAQVDFPHMSECNKCGSEWVTDCGDITLDARDFYTPEENKKLGRNLDSAKAKN
jgi:hypothetical protein